MHSVIDHLWQSTLFILVAWLLTLMLRNNAAKVRYWVWLAVSVKFLIPFSLLTLFGSQVSWRASTQLAPIGQFFATVQQIAEPLAAPPAAMVAPIASGFNFVPALLAIWTAGSVALLNRWLVKWSRVKAAVRASKDVEIDAPIAAKLSPLLSEPGVVGVFRPVLLLPEGIVARLTPAQLKSILAHELCHVRRRDNLTATIHMLVEVIFWFHPLVWWIGTRLIEERERACDEAVVELGNEPQIYAEGILKVCQLYMESKLTCVAGVSGANLRRRVETIMKNRIANKLNITGKILLATTSAVAVVSPVIFGLAGVQQVSAKTQDISMTSLTFDKVWIRRTLDDHISLMLKDGKFSARGFTLRNVIGLLHQWNDALVIGGPDWLDSLRYNIEAEHTVTQASAKPGPWPDREAAKAAQTRDVGMVKALLEDRFKLKTHWGMQQRSGFVLKTAESGPKLKPAAEATGRINLSPESPSYEAATLEMLAHDLSRRLNVSIEDRTGLVQQYDFQLRGLISLETVPAALDQLGLKLEPQALSVRILVVDHVEQPRED